jgi:endonuclease YncB( thermonuclease family)
MFKYNAKVERVVDGDTVDAMVDKGNFILESHGVGKFGRCLGSLHVDDVNINKVLVSEGYANEYYGGKR